MTGATFLKITAMLTIALTLIQGCGKADQTTKKSPKNASGKITGLTGYINGAIAARHKTTALACAVQLNNLQSAKEMFLLKNPDQIPSISTLVKSGFLSNPPKCGAGGTYKLGPPGVAPTCSCGNVSSP